MPASPLPGARVTLPLTPDDGAVASFFTSKFVSLEPSPHSPRIPKPASYTFLSVRPGNSALFEVHAEEGLPRAFVSRACFCGILGSPNLFWSREDKAPPAPTGVRVVDTLGDLFCGRPVLLKSGPRAFPPNRFFVAIEGTDEALRVLKLYVSTGAPNRIWDGR